MDLEADETSLGISWAAGSFIPGVEGGSCLLPLWGPESLELKWGPKDTEPSDTLPRDL